MSSKSREPSMDVLKKLQIPVKLLRMYHRHEVHGLKNLPRQGPCLVVLNHSLATYDMGLLFEAIYDRTGRLCRPLIDRLFYKIPAVGPIMEYLGAQQGSHENARSLLSRGEIVSVAPGGMREALRPSTERYQIRWENRFGFVRLACETQTPIVLACCPEADRLYEVKESPITQWAYKNFKIPLFFASGFKNTPLPRPVKLAHYLSKPIKPPKLSSDVKKQRAQIERFHKKIVAEMNALLRSGEHHHGAPRLRASAATAK